VSASTRVGFLGPAGSFTHETARVAADQLGWREIRLVSFPSGPAAVEAVARGEVDFAVVPVATSLNGPIEETAEPISACAVDQVALLRRTCHYALLGLPAATIAGIGVVFSHPEALADCRISLERLTPGATLAPFSSTAAAARHVALQGRPDWAAVAPASAARHYGLIVLAGFLEDDPSNETTWAVLGRRRRARWAALTRAPVLAFS
jgi:prephenate dehydratase